ncbi:MAG TPA: penicillin acylase family protein, partial [Candidatus Hydrogenedentes bacterium]|nr:penicillin acylase family protein [Candidatus Hydrogenedentota bacterium]
MLSRRAILLLSLTISALIYLAVLALAPHVTLLAANRDVPPELIRFRVRVQPPEPEPSPEKPAPDTRNPEPSPEAIRQQLAELFGVIALDLDRANRLHRFRHRARQALTTAPAQDQALIAAYAAGVN